MNSSSHPQSSSRPGQPPSSSAPPSSSQHHGPPTHQQPAHQPHHAGAGGATVVLHNEDRLKRAWRGIASTVVVAATKADRAAAAADGAGATAADASDPALHRELDEAVVALLKSRRDFSTLITYLECKLLGTEEEGNVLRSYVACQPTCASANSRKKRARGDEDEGGGLPDHRTLSKQAQEDDIPLQPLLEAAADPPSPVP